MTPFIGLLTCLGDELGKGQYGKVYKGKCRGENVAVKVLFKDNSKDWNQAVVEAFEKEVEIMSQIHHPNVGLCMALKPFKLVVLLMGACTEEDNMCIVTELLDGNLHDILHSPDIRLSNLQKLNFAIDVACGMAWLHNAKPHQIIHRDCMCSKLVFLIFSETFKPSFG